MGEAHTRNGSIVRRGTQSVSTHPYLPDLTDLIGMVSVYLDDIIVIIVDRIILILIVSEIVVILLSVQEVTIHGFLILHVPIMGCAFQMFRSVHIIIHFMELLSSLQLLKLESIVHCEDIFQSTQSCLGIVLVEEAFGLGHINTSVMEFAVCIIGLVMAVVTAGARDLRILNESIIVNESIGFAFDMPIMRFNTVDMLLVFCQRRQVRVIQFPDMSGHRTTEVAMDNRSQLAVGFGSQLES